MQVGVLRIQVSEALHSVRLRSSAGMHEELAGAECRSWKGRFRAFSTILNLMLNSCATHFLFCSKEQRHTLVSDKREHDEKKLGFVMQRLVSMLETATH